MHFIKTIIGFMCNPPTSIKGDYEYTERKYLNLSLCCQMLITFTPALISLFVDININQARLMMMLPLYAFLMLVMYLRWYKILTGALMACTVLMQIFYWMSVDRGFVLFTPFYIMINASTFSPSKKFLVIGFGVMFSVSCFIIQPRFIDFLKTSPRDEIVLVFERSFSAMLQLFTVSFCHLFAKRYIREKVYTKLIKLKSTISAQNQELKKVNDDLTKALESRESFILSFSHETRNPLNGIIGNLHLLSEMKLDAKAKQYLQRANICSKILNNILLTILDSQRTGQSAVDIRLRRRTIDMPVFIQEIWTLCREIIRSKEVMPILDVSPLFPRWVEFDAERVTQVIMNLVSNAIKFTQKGYIKVSFEWKVESGRSLLQPEMVFFESLDSKLKEELEHENEIYPIEWFDGKKPEEKGSMLVSVADTGCGISEEDQDVIFEKFSQLNENTELKSLGLGLGLWIAKAIVNLHEGGIVVRSRKGCGSCFTATISTNSKALNQKQPVFSTNALLTEPALRKEALKALIVEDFAINQKINSEMLRKYGFTHTEIAADGLEGLHIFKTRGANFFDLVTMDLEMPVMKGKEAMAEMRRWEERNNIAPTNIIVISGNAVDKEVNECLDCKGSIRADAFLTKPCSYKALAETIRRLKIEIKEPPLSERKLVIVANPVTPSQKRPCILFADDDFFNLDILIAYAQKMNLEYLTANDGEEACNVFQKHLEGIDMVILDFKMPRMSGPDACDKMRQKMEACHKKCPIYLLSGMNEVKEEVTHKFDGIIQKPLTIGKFEEVILNHFRFETQSQGASLSIKKYIKPKIM